MAARRITSVMSSEFDLRRLLRYHELGLGSFRNSLQESRAMPSIMLFGCECACRAMPSTPAAMFIACSFLHDACVLLGGRGPGGSMQGMGGTEEEGRNSPLITVVQ